MLKKQNSKSLIYMGPTITTKEGVIISEFDIFKGKVPNNIQNLEIYKKIEILIVNCEDVIQMKKRLSKSGSREFLIYKSLKGVK